MEGAVPVPGCVCIWEELWALSAVVLNPWNDGKDGKGKGNSGTGSTKPGQKQPWDMEAVIDMLAFIFKLPNRRVLKWWLCSEIKQRSNI